MTVLNLVCDTRVSGYSTTQVNGMILDLLPKLHALRIVLASASTRRLEILRLVGLDPIVQPSTFAEDLDKSAFSPEQYVIETARFKALDVVNALLKDGGAMPDIVISSDSIVLAGSRILEKPKNQDECREMMHLLSGKTHRVLSSYCVVAFGSFSTIEDNGTPPVALEMHGHHAVLFTGVGVTEVDFTVLAADTVETYVKTKDPYDKAGGYGIQGIAAQFVSAIRGDFYNVVGLPICQVCKILRSICLAKLP